MKKISTFFLFLSCIIFLSSAASGQNFLWGRSGGSASPTQGIDDESVIDMAVDQNGNVYILSYIFDTNPNVAGQPVLHFGFGDVLVASFAPDGSTRWVKVIGGGSSDIPLALETDKNGGVYVAANLNLSNGGGHIDNDATLPQTYQAQILVKYDINGNYQWHKLPQADTVTAQSWSTTGFLDMNADGNGNVYILAQLAPGKYGNSAVISTLGDYILKFSASGNFNGVINIDAFFEEENAGLVKMSFDEVNQRFYLAGGRELFSGKTVRTGSTTVSPGMYVSSFDANGNFLWVKENAKDVGSFTSKPIIDNNGNVYVYGGAQGESSTLTPPTGPDYFNGYEIKNGNASSTPFIMKIDMNGNKIWARDADVNGAVLACGLALRTNDEIIISGSYPGNVSWPGFSDTVRIKPPNEAYDMFITRFSSSDGSVRGMDWVTSTSGYNEYPTCMVGDGNGNVYIGGELYGDLKVGLDNLVNIGGPTDFFLAKYGNMWPSDVNSSLSTFDVLCYPNPAVNSLFIDNAVDATIQLSDITGRILTTRKLHSAHETIDVSAYPSGNYLLKFTGKNGDSITKKIVKG